MRTRAAQGTSNGWGSGSIGGTSVEKLPSCSSLSGNKLKNVLPFRGGRRLPTNAI